MEVQVIEKIQGRIDRTTGLQINRKLKVAAYARVSTDSEDQLNSFESQVKYYNEKISKNIELTYYNENGEKIQKQLNGFFARLVQHECDHIDGIVFLE